MANVLSSQVADDSSSAAGGDLGWAPMAVRLRRASSCFYLAALALSQGRFFRLDSPTCAFAADSGKSRSKGVSLTGSAACIDCGCGASPLRKAPRLRCEARLGWPPRPAQENAHIPESRCLAKNLRNARSLTSHGTKRCDMHFSNGPTCVMRRVVCLPSCCFPSSAACPFFHAARARV